MTNPAASPSIPDGQIAPRFPTPGEAFRVWLRIALLSFGGPAGQIAVMHRILVEEKHWISESRFLHALNYCMLLPGPEAQQLATYIGWLMHKTRGGIIAGGLFIAPGVIAIMALSAIYAAFGNVGFVAALFFGLMAAVLAIVLQAVVRVGNRALGNRLMQGLAAAAFIAIFFFSVPFPVIVLMAGMIGYAGGRAGLGAFAGRGHDSNPSTALVDSLLGDELPPHVRPARRALRVAAIWLLLWLAPVALLLALLGAGNVFSQIAVFFSKMAMVTSMGCYAVLAYVAQQAVENYHWLKPNEMLDGLGMAETTPAHSSWCCNSWASWRHSAILERCRRCRRTRRPAGNMGHVHAVLPVDFPGRAVYRNPAPQQGACGRAVRHHCGGGRCDSESGDLVCDPHHLPTDSFRSRFRIIIRRAGADQCRSMGAGARHGGRVCDFPFEGRDGANTGSLRLGGRAALCDRHDLNGPGDRGDRAVSVLFSNTDRFGRGLSCGGSLSRRSPDVY